MRTGYSPGAIVGPYTLVEHISKDKWICKCNLCGSVVDVFTDNAKRQRMCRNCRTKYNCKPKIDIEGRRFSRLVAIKYLGKSKWLCKCDCGKEIIVSTGHLMSGHTNSCGCYLADLLSETRLKDLTGQRFTKLVVENRIEDYIAPSGSRLTQYRCRCDCGTVVDVLGINLQKGNTKSCGCLGASYGEYYIANRLNELNIPFEKEYSFADLRSPNGGLLRYDFAIFDKTNKLICLIEFHGEQHFYAPKRKTEFGRMQREITDKIKTEYCNENNILLYVIRYDDDIQEKLEEIIQHMSTPCQASQTGLKV